MFAVALPSQNEVQEQPKGEEYTFQTVVRENEYVRSVLHRLMVWFLVDGRGGGKQISRFICSKDENPSGNKRTYRKCG